MKICLYTDLNDKILSKNNTGYRSIPSKLNDELPSLNFNETISSETNKNERQHNSNI